MKDEVLCNQKNSFFFFIHDCPDVQTLQEIYPLSSGASSGVLPGHKAWGEQGTILHLGSRCFPGEGNGDSSWRASGKQGRYFQVRRLETGGA